MKNVILFPEKQMQKVKKQKGLETRNAILSLSLASLMIGAVLLNDTVARPRNALYIVSDNGTPVEALNRAIASAKPMNPFRDLEWEKTLAKKMGHDKVSVTEDRIPASLGKSASKMDELRFGSLAGKYSLGGTESSISEISYIDPVDSNENPVFLDPEKFLQDYGALFTIHFDLYDKANPAQTNVREYRLLGQDKKVVGTAAFTMDDSGKFLSLKIRSAGQN